MIDIVPMFTYEEKPYTYYKNVMWIRLAYILGVLTYIIGLFVVCKICSNKTPQDDLNVSSFTDEYLSLN